MGDDYLEEHKNTLVDLGLQAVLGNISTQQALDEAKTNPQIQMLPDDQLEALILQAERHWRAKVPELVGPTQNLTIYPAVIDVAAQTRLEAIGRLRPVVPEAERPALERRMARWLGLMSRCFAGFGQCVLLVPGQEENSFRYFMHAYSTARALPDDGQLRLKEVMTACFGLVEAARRGGQAELARPFEEEWKVLVAAPGREAEAAAYRAEVEAAFRPFLEFVPETHIAPAEEPDDDHTTRNVQYKQRIESETDRVLKGEIDEEHAATALLAELAPDGPDARAVYWCSVFTRGSGIETNPARAVVSTGLNYRVSQALTGELAELTRGYCGAVLGLALESQMRKGKFDEATISRAIAVLEEAYRLLDDADGEARSDAALSAGLLVNCYRRGGDLAAARRWGELALAGFKALQIPSAVAVTYDNLARVAEAAGDPQEAFGLSYESFEYAMRAGDPFRVRTALEQLMEQATRVGRGDDAAAAADRAASLLMQTADLPGAIEVCFQLALSQFRTGDMESSFRTFDRAEKLLRGLDPGHPRYPTLAYQHLSSLGFAESLLFIVAVRTGSSDARERFEKASQTLESARQIALRLNDPNRLASAWYQIGMLQFEAGNLDAAETVCHSLLLLGGPHRYGWRFEGLLGQVQTRQGRFAEAVATLERAAAATPDDLRDLKAAVLQSLAEAHEKAGDDRAAVAAYVRAAEESEKVRGALNDASRLRVMSNAKDVYERLVVLHAAPGRATYDPKQALFWLERFKARTFVDALGLNPIPLAAAPDSSAADLAREGEALAELRRLRNGIFVGPELAPDRLESQHRVAELTDELNALWDRLAPALPEYVELRRGIAADPDTLLAWARAGL